jgi:hypothetical protein
MDANMVRIRDDHATVRMVVQEDLSHVDSVQIGGHGDGDEVEDLREDQFYVGTG